MKRYLPIILTMLAVGCLKDPQHESATSARPAGLTQNQVTQLAANFTADWLKQNPSESQLTGNPTIREIKSTNTGWHITFEWVSLSKEPEGESHHFLHVYIDSKGNLEKIVRGLDEIT